MTLNSNRTLSYMLLLCMGFLTVLSIILCIAFGPQIGTFLASLLTVFSSAGLLISDRRLITEYGREISNWPGIIGCAVGCLLAIISGIKLIS